MTISLVIQVKIALEFLDSHSNVFFSLLLADGPSWAWKILNVLPIEFQLQYTAFMSQSLRTRLQIITYTMDFLQNQIQPATVSTNNGS